MCTIMVISLSILTVWSKPSSIETPFGSFVEGEIVTTNLYLIILGLVL